MPCSENLIWVHCVFWPMAVLTVVAIARHNRFGLKNAMLAIPGLKPFERSTKINILQAGTLLLPLGLALWIIDTCPG